MFFTNLESPEIWIYPELFLPEMICHTPFKCLFNTPGKSQPPLSQIFFATLQNEQRNVLMYIKCQKMSLAFL